MLVSVSLVVVAHLTLLHVSTRYMAGRHDSDKVGRRHNCCPTVAGSGKSQAVVGESSRRTGHRTQRHSSYTLQTYLVRRKT